MEKRNNLSHWCFNSVRFQRVLVSKRKTIKIRIFPGATAGDMKFFMIPHLRKSPDKIFLHFGPNDAPQEMFNAIKCLKLFMPKKQKKNTPESKKIISTPVLRVDKAS